MFYYPSNMNEIGTMKDESEGELNTEFVGLKSKMCFIIDVDCKENKKGKGVVKNIKRK